MRRLLVSVLVVAVATSGLVALAASSAQASVTVPAAPRSVRGTPGNGQAVVSWQKPLSNGGEAIDAYEVVTYLLERPRPTNVFHSTALSETILNLTNGKSYTFKVAAHNAKGWGRLSAESAPVTVGVPSSPTNVFAAPGSAQATVSWTAPASSSGSPITAYRVTPITGANTLAARTFNNTATMQVITGLTNGKTYSFRVAAQNARGWGGQSVESAGIVVGAPVAPTGVSGLPGSARATVSWTAPATVNGSAITAYRVTASSGSADTVRVFDSTATSQVFTGLANGTVYRFRVEAHNTRGWGPRSVPSAPVTSGAPLAPTNVTAVPGSKQATVSWTAPSVDNGSPVGAYEVIPYHSGVALAARVYGTPATSHVITGLVNGQPYRFRVVAHNSRGWGPKSALSSPVAPS